jgi:hypothetical protein
MTEILSLVVVVVHQLLDDGKKYCFILFNNGLKFLLVSVNKTKTKPKRSLHDILVELKKKTKLEILAIIFFCPNVIEESKEQLYLKALLFLLLL